MTLAGPWQTLNPPMSGLMTAARWQLRRAFGSVRLVVEVRSGQQAGYAAHWAQATARLASPCRRSPLRTLASASSQETATVPAPATSADPSPQKLSGSEIREKFLSFYEGKGHRRLPSSSLVPEDPTVLLTIAGMLQFKPIFLGQAPRQHPRVTTTQKCVRTNDIENVGVTKRHHTFFEMLGNFSFGDYFKEDACRMAWELSTRVFGLPVERVWVSVYEQDEEAYTIWRDIVGVAPERIKRMGAEDNFWASGPTGPCGPCSELYYDFHPERGMEGASLEDDSRFIEFYNLVFMESNRAADGTLSPLSAQNIDTGMGLERMAQILQCVPNNYETDLIFPIVAKAASLAGVDYHTADARTRTALKVIGDHTRAVAYLISDGVNPSNVGRGYVVRRLIRRVVMKGRLLGIRDIFTPAVAAVAVELSAACDPQLQTNAARVYDELAREEGRFVSTLESGEKILREILARAAASPERTVSGADAFLLYDTFGFPLEVTLEIAEEQGVQVDTFGFEREMEAQRTRSKEAFRAVDLTADNVLGQLAAGGDGSGTEFVGYSALSATAMVLGLVRDGQLVQQASAGEAVDIILDRTPFYAESGGQTGDTGLLAVSSASSSSGDGAAGQHEAVVLVRDVQRGAGGSLSVHKAEVQNGSISVGQQVSASVDAALRKRARCNHTATHLLQAALKQVLGPDTSQQGSLVGFDRLRFDFNLPRGMSGEEVQRVEQLVNGWIQEGRPLATSVMALQQAKDAGAIAMFGEKYGEVVRVVDVPGVSLELCGGTHVDNTAEIGGFKVLSESGIASGVRRIEAVAGPAVMDYLNSLDGVVRTLSSQFKAKPDDIPTRIAGLVDELKAAQKQVAELNSALAAAKCAVLAQRAQRQPSGAQVLVELVEGVDPKALQEAAIALQQQLGDPSAVVLGTALPDGKASLAAAFSPGVVAGGLQAGKVVGAAAKVCGGGGGGRPAIAQAGGKDASKLGEALQAARQQLLDGL